MDPAAWAETTAEWDEVGPSTDEVPPAVQRAADASRRRRSSARARVRARQPAAAPTVHWPAFLARSDIASDRMALALLGANAISLGAMAAVLSSQMGGLPTSLAIHLDAAGVPDRWGSPKTLWRLPLLAGMTTVMNLVVAWAISSVDRFAARFVLAAALVVHLIAWVAVFDFV